MRSVLALFFTLALVSCSKSSSSGSGDPNANASGGAGGTKSWSSPPAMQIDPAKTYSATMVTAKGTIELSLDAKAAPNTVNNFVFLARQKFYDGLTFHRVVPSFVIQGGDPQGTGEGGPGYSIPDENSGLKHVDGALAMAKSSAPNSAGSQFYICLGPQPALDGNYTVFGVVTNGKDVPGKIVKGDTITTVTITEK
jgi:cyclophilin family peptidyl-prolyl cis-trans isomerase